MAWPHRLGQRAHVGRLYPTVFFVLKRPRQFAHHGRGRAHQDRPPQVGEEVAAVRAGPGARERLAQEQIPGRVLFPVCLCLATSCRRVQPFLPRMLVFGCRCPLCLFSRVLLGRCVPAHPADYVLREAGWRALVLLLEEARLDRFGWPRSHRPLLDPVAQDARVFLPAWPQIVHHQRRVPARRPPRRHARH